MGVEHHPLWYCGFRVFFLASAASAVSFVLLWSGQWLGWWSITGALTGPVGHAQQMLMGTLLAGGVGFLLTAIPEFTGSQEFKRWQTKLLFCLWLLARLAGMTENGLLVCALADIGMLGILLAILLPRFTGAGRQHLSFAICLVLLWLLVCGFYYDAWSEPLPMRYLLAISQLWLILVVIAASRISMRIVNQALLDMGCRAEYLARPPRRNLAILMVGLFGLVEFYQPHSLQSGYLALAVACAFFNLLNDWHLGRVLFRPYVLFLYLGYWAIAVGHLLMGIALLQGESASGGRHLALMGGAGLMLMAVLLIAGRSHSGLTLDRRPWIVGVLALLLCAALFRAFYGYQWQPAWLITAALCWILAFALYLWFFSPILLGRRADGKTDCSGP